MTVYRVAFQVPLNLTVTVAAGNEEIAADAAWPHAQEYLETLTGDGYSVTADASLDGIGADAVREVPS